MELKVCENCTHFHPSDRDRQNGECHIEPPKVFWSAQGREFTAWPKVDGQDWCSKFLSRDNAYSSKKQQFPSPSKKRT